MELVPEKRLEQLLTEISPTAAATFGGVGPCCGFSTQYACMCDFHGLPYRDEVAWVSERAPIKIQIERAVGRFLSTLSIT